MSPSQGWFESDDDYRNRVSKEADERTIKESTGSEPSQGWFESDENYRDRISREANEHIIEDSGGSRPSQGWFESDEAYSERISREANERVIEDSTGASPSQGWLESNNDYETRIRKEANEQTIARGSSSKPNQGWLEGDHAYRSRIAHEARETRASGRSDSPSNYGYIHSATSSSASSSDFGNIGFIIALIIIAGVIYSALSSSPSVNRSSTSKENSSDSQAGRSSERVVDRPCFAFGDALIFTDTNLHVPESRLAKYSKIRNTSSGEDGLCSVMADPPGFHWLSCYRDIGGNGGYMSSRSDDSRYLLRDVVEVVPGIQIDTRTWQGSCKVRS